MEIVSSVIHKIVKDTLFDVGGEGGAEKVDLIPADKIHDLEDDSQLIILANLLEKRIRSAGKGSSKLKNPIGGVGAAGSLEKYFTGQKSFYDFSISIAEILKEIAPPTASGGYLSLIEYKVDGSHFLFVSILKLEDGVTIDPNSLVVRDATSIQHGAIHEGTRIEIPHLLRHIWDESRSHNYMNWIKTKKGQKLSSYFQKIFVIDTEIDDRKQTSLFKRAVESFIKGVLDEISFNEEDENDIHERKAEISHAVRSSVYELVNTHASNSTALDFDSVDDAIKSTIAAYDLESETTFVEFSSNNFSDLSNLFKPFVGITKTWGIHKEVIKSEQNHTIKLFVDQAMVKNPEYFSPDEDNKTVTLKNVSQSFFDSIK